MLGGSLFGFVEDPDELLGLPSARCSQSLNLPTLSEFHMWLTSCGVVCVIWGPKRSEQAHMAIRMWWCMARVSQYLQVFSVSMIGFPGVEVFTTCNMLTIPPCVHSKVLKNRRLGKDRSEYDDEIITQKWIYACHTSWYILILLLLFFLKSHIEVPSLCISIFPNMNPGSQQLSVESLRLRYLDERPIFPVERSGMARGLNGWTLGREVCSNHSMIFGPFGKHWVITVQNKCMCSLSPFHWHRYRSAKVALHGQKVVCRWGSDNHRGQLGKWRVLPWQALQQAKKDFFQDVLWKLLEFFNMLCSTQIMCIVCIVFNSRYLRDHDPAVIPFKTIFHPLYTRHPHFIPSQPFTNRITVSCWHRVLQGAIPTTKCRGSWPKRIPHAAAKVGHCHLA